MFFSFKLAWGVFECRCSFDGFIVSFNSTEEQTTHTANSSLQFLRSAYVYVVFWTFLIFGRGEKCFRLNHLADPLQYLRGPPGGRGPPVEDLWFSALIYRCTQT